MSKCSICDNEYQKYDIDRQTQIYATTHRITYDDKCYACLKKELSKVDNQYKEQSSSHNSESSVIVFSIILAIAAGIGNYFYFQESLWTIINVIASIFVGFFVVGGIASFSSKSGASQGLAAFALCGLLVFCLHSCFYVSPQERAAREERAAQEEQIYQEKMRKAAEEDERITKEFLNSGNEFQIYGEAQTSSSSAERRVKNFIKTIVHDPDSVQDVIIESKVVHCRVKHNPFVRFAVQASFRARNQFGVLVLTRGIVLLDGNVHGIELLPDKAF